MFKLYRRHLVILISLVLFTAAFSQIPDPQRFAQEIETFRQWDAKNAVPVHPVLFIGSSSIRMWKTAEAFPELPVVNRGFGGAQIPDILYFMQDVLLKYREPSVLVFYCGDNDAASGKSAQEIAQDFQTFVETARKTFPALPIIYIPIKPSPSRWSLWPVMEQANDLINAFCGHTEALFYADIVTPMLATGQPPAADLFLEDGLHLTDKGYALWKQVIEPLIRQARQN